MPAHLVRTLPRIANLFEQAIQGAHGEHGSMT